jgi:hypothetical protein
LIAWEPLWVHRRRRKRREEEEKGRRRRRRRRRGSGSRNSMNKSYSVEIRRPPTSPTANPDSVNSIIISPSSP